MGFSRGDGSDKNDAAIWFGVRVADVDGSGPRDDDGLSHWAERIEWGTDPKNSNSDGEG